MSVLAVSLDVAAVQGVSVPLAGGVPGTADAVAVQSSGDGDSGLALVAGFFIGLYLIYDGFGKWRTKRLMEDTPTEKVRSMAAGRTELDGVAHSDGETVEAPVTDEGCLHIDWEFEEWRKDPDDDDYNWVTRTAAMRNSRATTTGAAPWR